uniref:Uncharacterized protein n=1 Tax=Cucumis melo TaxID=3656 RepID=A0A9I9EG07_CUCME
MEEETWAETYFHSENRKIGKSYNLRKLQAFMVEWTYLKRREEEKRRRRSLNDSSSRPSLPSSLPHHHSYISVFRV